MKKNKREIIVAHTSEITLKGKNRDMFEKELLRNIMSRFGKRAPQIKHMGARFIFETEKHSPDELLAILQTVPGIETLAYAYAVASDPETITAEAVSLMQHKDFDSFRITARRMDKKFPKGSQDVAKEVGAAVQVATDSKVSLKNFDLNLHIDIERDETYLYFEKIRGAGGLPIGSSGDLLVLLSGGIDSPVAAHMMQTRGSRVVCINFDAYPATPIENKQNVEKLAGILGEIQGGIDLYIVPFLDLQKEVMRVVPEDYRVIFYRRMMMRIATRLADDLGVQCLVTGESLGQVASQTVYNIRAVEEATMLPILRPLIGMHKNDIIIKARAIGTYETSIQPFEDCCSLYVPKHPVTKANLQKIAEVESSWEFEEIINTAYKNIEKIST